MGVKVTRLPNRITKEGLIKLNLRVLREIKVWAALDHPNILPFYGFSNKFGEFLSMISMWCPLGNAETFLGTDNFDLAIRLKLMHNVVRGLCYLHKLGIVHGDLKPQNILIWDGPIAMLCDFGLIRLMDWGGETSLITSSPYRATAKYTAPELRITDKNPKPRASFPGDIYALGCVGLYFVEGEEPYADVQQLAHLHQMIDSGRQPGVVTSSMIEDESIRESFWALLTECWRWPEYNDRPKVEAVETVICRLYETLCR